MHDCGFTKGNNWFRYRAGGFLIENDKILFAKSKFGGYYYMIGGGVHLGETSKNCIEREVYEETGIKAKAERLAVVCENFFQGTGGDVDGLACHTMEFYYLMTMQEEPNFIEEWKNDAGEELTWLPIHEIPNADIKPAFIKDYIDEIMHGENVLHIVWEKDR